MPLGLYKLAPANGEFDIGSVVEFCPLDWVSPDAFPFYPAGRCPGGGEPMLKEVVAVGGDVVEVTDSGVFINGVYLSNSKAITKPGLPRIRQRFVLKKSEIWVFGSGATPVLAQHSFDSRYFGPVPVLNVAGVQNRD